jgi:hypothetical protein
LTVKLVAQAETAKDSHVAVACRKDCSVSVASSVWCSDFAAPTAALSCSALLCAQAGGVFSIEHEKFEDTDNPQAVQ